jgi:hypothetical protein
LVLLFPENLAVNLGLTANAKKMYVYCICLSCKAKKPKLTAKFSGKSKTKRRSHSKQIYPVFVLVEQSNCIDSIIVKPTVTHQTIAIFLIPDYVERTVIV